MDKKSILSVTVAAYILIGFLMIHGKCSTTHDDRDGGTAEDCDDACAVLKEYQCAGWEGSPGTDEIFGTADDVPCVKVCQDLMNADESMTLFPACTAKAKNCDDVDNCFEEGH